MVFRKIVGTVYQRTMLEHMLAESARNTADIAYIAMMCGVELEATGEENENEEIEEA